MFHGTFDGAISVIVGFFLIVIGAAIFIGYFIGVSVESTPTCLEYDTKTGECVIYSK